MSPSLRPLEVVPPGSAVQIGDVPARVVEVCVGTSLKPEYLLNWWDGRSLQGARFDRDQFTLAADAPTLPIGFGCGA